jgi:hypothetical protein
VPMLHGGRLVCSPVVCAVWLLLQVLLPGCDAASLAVVPNHTAFPGHDSTCGWVRDSLQDGWWWLSRFAVVTGWRQDEAR